MRQNRGNEPDSPSRKIKNLVGRAKVGKKGIAP
jgi:hypothetical protein